MNYLMYVVIVYTTSHICKEVRGGISTDVFSKPATCISIWIIDHVTRAGYIPYGQAQPRSQGFCGAT